ncbi:MFS transporter [Roseomonas frigidaquae]|uniref:MFS transporter n=1 Tax=Falsiroseomonas frigidaquae TaxID=487318 RepID=A0ABX1ERB3_9PROT|nr:MFS transporter [Falsiroseomonas frigidaquae]NKE43161.1 MFS transporter [Falsiroseomonas frigidaquae]
MTEGTPAEDTPAARDPVLPVLMVAVFCGSLAMMAFVALIGPVARVAGLQPWQAGLAVTASGVAWMLGARPWGRASDRHGRRAVLLAGALGFTLAYWALCLFIDAMLRWQVPVTLAFLGLVAGRALVGGAYAAIPAAGMALIADRTEPAKRAQAMARLGTGSGAGLVAGPALAALLVPYGLSVPLIATAALPLLACLALWWLIPATPPKPSPPRRRLKLTDRRLRQPLAIGFSAMFSVSIAQVSIGFFAMDRLGLPPEDAARAAGTALMMVGIALVLSQSVAARWRIAPERMIRLGALAAALGFGSVVLASQAWMLAACYFVAALGMGWVFPAFSAMTANAVEPGEQGAAAGAAGAAQGLGMVVGPVAGTLLYAVAPALPYVLASALLLGVSLPLWRQARDPLAVPSA